MKSRARQLLDKSVCAMLAAIEVYNKPTFAYREESFSILAVNAWELLLKARILQVSNNRISSILVYEKRKRADGTPSRMLYRKKNRSCNDVSVGILRALDLLVNDHFESIDNLVRKNIEAIIEIRDNAVHFMNNDFDLVVKINEVGTATLKNYLNLSKKWFGVDLSDHNIFLMPIAFLRDLQGATAIVPNRQERKLLDYMKGIEEESNSDTNLDYNFSLGIDINIRRVNDPAATPYRLTNSPDATPIVVQEEDIREKYPWDYGNLTSRLRKRYSNFLANQNYHQIRKPLEDNLKYCKPRYLDPSNTNGTKKNFYNPNIVREFDKHYARQAK